MSKKTNPHTLGYEVLDLNDDPQWIVRLAPQCMTDILVRVATADKREETLFTFEIGKVLLEMVDDLGCIDGVCGASAAQRAIILRWASNLETIAQTIRAGLEPWEDRSAEEDD